MEPKQTSQPKKRLARFRENFLANLDRKKPQRFKDVMENVLKKVPPQTPVGQFNKLLDFREKISPMVKQDMPLSDIIPKGDVSKPAIKTSTPIAESLMDGKVKFSNPVLLNAIATIDKDYFKPSPNKLRARDFLREIPDQTTNTITSVLQSISRNILLGSQIAAGRNFEEARIKPTTRIEEILTGVEAGNKFTLADEGKDIVSIVSDELANKISEDKLTIIGAISVFSDMLPGGQSKKSLSVLAKSSDDNFIRNTLQTLFKGPDGPDGPSGLSNTVIEKIVPLIREADTVPKVQKIIQDAVIAEQLKREGVEAILKQADVKSPTDIPDDLIQEARKYKSAEEFVKKIQGSATQYGDYFPHLRKFGMEDYKNITELGIDPDEMITIYRGIDDTTGRIPKKINDGDFVTTDYNSAWSYAGDNVVSMEVPAKTLYTDAVEDFTDEPFYTGSEYVYTTEKVTPMNKSQLEEIWKQANETPTPKDVEIKEENITEQIEGGDIVPPDTEDIIENILPPKKRLRKTIENVEKSDSLPESMKEYTRQLSPDERYYDIVTDKDSIQRAEKNVSEDKDKALLEILTSDKIDKDTVTTAVALIDTYNKSGNFAVSAQIVSSIAERATRAGQYNQAISILYKLTPEGWTFFAQRKIGRKLLPEENKYIFDKATEIVGMEKGYAKSIKEKQIGDYIQEKKKQEKFADFKNKTQREKVKLRIGQAGDVVLQLLDLFKTAAAGFFDFSATLQQGILIPARHPKIFAKNLANSFKAFWDELPGVSNIKAKKGKTSFNEEIMDRIIKHKDFDDVKDYVKFTDPDGVIAQKDAIFMSSLAEKIPIIPKEYPKGVRVLNYAIKFYNAIPGKLFRATSVAYQTFLNGVRMDIASKLLRNFETINPNLKRSDEKFMREFGNMINDFTSAGDLGQKFQKYEPFFRRVLWSPGKVFSRINLLVPYRYVLARPEIRREYIKTMVAYASAVSTILVIADAVGGEDVEVNTQMTNADFAKIKSGDTRFDIAGGFQQYLRMGAQLATGTYISSSTGRVITLGEGYNPITRLDVLGRNIETKLSPVASLVVSLFRGSNFMGEDFRLDTEVGNRFVPMFISDLIEINKEDPELLPLGVLGLFGVGVQSYPKPKAYRMADFIKNSPNPTKELLRLKKENPIFAQQVEKAMRESTFNEFDWGLTYFGVENGERAQFLYEHMQNLSVEESIALRNELTQKGLISNQVNKQLINLLRQGNTQE